MIIETFLREVVVLLGSGVAVLLVCGMARVPPIIGFLVTGILIGPHGLGWISSRHEIELFAEIGAGFLLFAIGLEVSPTRLKELRRPFLVGGAVQAAVTFLVAAAVGSLLALEPRRAVFIGCVVVLSSTAVVLKLYADRGDTDTPHGRTALGILLFQDFLIVPIIAVTPLLAGSNERSTGQTAVRIVAAVLAMTAAAFLARLVLPRALDLIVRTRVREAFVLAAVTVCLGTAWLSHELGFSLALGAFIGGVLISDSTYIHQVVADIAPLRDLFASVFFISIGMLLDLPFLAAAPLAVAALVAGILLLKIVAAGVATLLLGFPLRVAILVALSLAQIGEFSFVLMDVGRSNGLLTGDRFQLLLAASVMSLMVTPILFAAATPLSRRLGTPAASPQREERPSAPALTGHVVVVGFGTVGRLLARVLKESRLRYVAVDISAEAVRRHAREGEPIIYGDAANPEILQTVGVEHANVVVFAISERAVLPRAVRAARQLAPGAEIIVRSRAVEDIETLRNAGADQVIAENFESAIEIFTRVLTRFHVPRNVIRAQTRVLRGESYRMLRAAELQRGVSTAVLDALAEGTTDVYGVVTGGPADGRSLREIDLRRRSGATVIAVVRDGTSELSPAPDLVLAGGDQLVLVGSHAEIDRAFELLASGIAS